MPEGKQKGTQDKSFFSLMRSHLSFLFWLRNKLTPYNEIYVGTHSIISVKGDRTTELYVAVFA